MTIKNTKNEALRRLKIAEGQLKKVITMVEEGSYCLDVLNQSLAVQNALKKVDEVILEDHLNGCVVAQINNGKGKQAATEVLSLFRRR